MIRSKAEIRRQMRELVGKKIYGAKQKLSREAAERIVSWKASSGHPRGWRVTSGLSNDFRELNDKRGRLIIFKSSESAGKRAAALNALERAQ